MNKNYLTVFPDIPELTGFFSCKDNAVEGAPFDNPEFFQNVGLADTMKVWPVQVHKDNIETIRQKSSDSVVLPNTDGAITDVPGVLLTTVHADCLPVYFYDPEHRAIGLVHAGWRGTQQGIAVKCVKQMAKEYGTNPEKLLVHIGPGISKCCFEVGPEVREAFAEAWDFIDEYAEAKGEKYYIDLKGINQRELTEARVLFQNIDVSEHCTHHEPELFCSYRREGGTYMRMGAGLCINE